MIHIIIASETIEVLSWIASIVGAIFAIVATIVSLLISSWAYKVTKKQFDFDIILQCVERFQAILGQLDSPQDSPERLRAVKRYIDLCNEELFYFKNKYVPGEVVDEWLDGMVQYLPHTLYDRKQENDKCLPEIDTHNLLDGYPRIQTAFRVSRKFDITKPSERMAIIKEIRSNLKNNK